MMVRNLGFRIIEEVGVVSLQCVTPVFFFLVASRNLINGATNLFIKLVL